MIYVDTSVVVALLTLEPKTEAAIAWYADLSETPISSDWLIIEFASAMSIKLRARQLSENNARRAHEEFDALQSGGLRVAAVSRTAFTHAAVLAKRHRHGLRAGDSLHLACALEFGASHVATLDADFARNATRSGLKIVEF
jgi:predicted nucleic acid-binding protein